MKEQKFFRMSEITLPLDELKLEDNELIAIKGGAKAKVGSGNNCNCECPAGDGAGSGQNCNCTCAA